MAIAVTMLLTLLGLPTPAGAAGAPVGLGTVGSYSVLGGQTVTNTGPTTLSGDLGVSPGTAITGFPPGVTGGVTHAADAAALQAQADLVIAYDDAAGRAKTGDISNDLVGLTLPSGVYKSTGPIGLSGTLTLDAQGDPNAVFIFQIASTLITASSSHVSMVNGAQACNVFWQIGSSATLGTTSTFIGTIMALTSISVTTGTVVDGRALARNGQVSLDTNVFTNSTCATSLPTSAPPTVTTAPPVTSAPVSTPPVVTPPVVTPPVVTPPVVTPPVVVPPVVTTPVVPSVSATSTAEASASGRAVTPTSSAPVTTASRAVVAARSSSSAAGRTTSQVGLTSNEVTLANTGLSPMLKPVLILGAALCLIGAITLLGGSRTQTVYLPRHY